MGNTSGKSEATAACGQQSQSSSSSASAGHPVSINVYNLQRASSKKKQSINGALGFGVYHSGLELFGKEWSFGGNPSATPEQSGIFATYPKTVLPVSQFHESVVLGLLPPHVKEMDVYRVIQSIQLEWRAVTYHLLSHNCNHFTQALRDALVEQLQVKLDEVPSYINRAARVADVFVPESLYQSLMARVPQSNGDGGVSSATRAPAKEAPPSAKIPSDRKALQSMSVRELKLLMSANRLPMDGIIEKSDMIDALMQLANKQRQR